MMKITRADMVLVRELNQKYFGNSLNEQKDLLIRNRLKKLFRKQTKYTSIGLMLHAIARGEFVQEFINTFTTNKTSFYREPIHFDDLLRRVFPEHFTTHDEIALYSCAASTGEEAYSIGITFMHYKAQVQRELKAEIFSTDIDTEVLEVANAGVYRYDQRSCPFPQWVQPQRYFQRRLLEGTEHALIKANDQLRSLIRFRQHNLLDEAAAYAHKKFDVIFCRNILIYFTPHDQAAVLRKLFATLKIGGTLYTGHSETPTVLYPYVDKIGPSIYRKRMEIV